MNYRLIIDGHDAELNENVSVALNKKYESLQDPTGYYTDYSKTVNLPMTRINNGIMSRIFRCDQVVTNNTIDPRKKIDFILLHNEELVMRGYLKVTNVYNSGSSKYYQVNLFSELGGLLNDMKQLTYDTDADDAKYIMPNVLSNGLMINRHIVKNSFEQESHNLDYNHKGDLDHIGFYCEYQGKYPDFESGQWVDGNTITDEYTRGSRTLKYDEQDEHYYHIHRSYYQRPYIWIDSLWQQVKHKMEAISDYTINLDPSFFNADNPYYSNLIYTLPSLYDTSTETEASSISEKFGYQWLSYTSHNSTQAGLSTHHKKIMEFAHASGSHLYQESTKRFNANTSTGFPMHFKQKMVWWLFAANEDVQLTNAYCRIREDNPLFITIRAISARDNSYIPGASYTVMLYSENLPDTNVYYDAAIDCGTTNRNHPAVVTIPDSSRGKDKGYWWSGEMTAEFDVNTTEPFYIIADNYAANNSDLFETAVATWIPRWDWLWNDTYDTTDNIKGHSVYLTCVNGSAEQTVNIRSNAELSMEKLWRSDKSVFDVLLEYAKIFHLVFDLDQENKVLNIMSRNRYFDDYSILDWTDKVDRNKDFILQPINFDKKYLIFGYDEGKGQRMEYYQSRYEANYGERKIDTGIEYNTDEDDLFESMTPTMICTKKQYSYWQDLQNILGDDREKYMPNEYFPENDNDGSSAEMNGQFYFRNGRYAVDAEIGYGGHCYITDDTETEIKKNTYCWHTANGLTLQCDYYPAISTYSSDGKYAIQFGEPKELYFNRDMVAYDDPTYIYEGFWKDYIDERWSVQNKVLTAYLYLDAADFKKYKFNQFVMIDNVLYLPNAIADFDVSNNESTKVELVQVYDKSGYLNSHIDFGYLYTDRNNLELTSSPTNINVYSTSDWRISEVSEWIGYYRNDDVLTVYCFEPSFAAALSGHITLINDDGHNYTINVSAAQQTANLRPMQRSFTFKSSGESKQLNLFSTPTSVSVQSKPSWIEIDFMAMYQNSNNISLTGNVSAMIRASENTSVFKRSGSIVLTNGYASCTIKVSQNGGMTVYRPDVNIDEEIERPIDLTPDTLNQLTLHTAKQIDLNTLKITNGNFSKKDGSGNDTRIVDTVIYQAVPTQSEAHVKLGKTSDGGQIKINTLDGDTIIWNYNIGDTITKYTAFISAGEGGYITIDGTNYYGAYLEDLEDGTEIKVSATGTDEEFSNWSDGNTDNPRTITIHSDIAIEAEYGGEVEERYYGYGNGDNVAFGDNKIISL